IVQGFSRGGRLQSTDNSNLEPGKTRHVLSARHMELSTALRGHSRVESCAVSRRGFDLDAAADEGSSLAHPEKSQALFSFSSGNLCGIEAAAVVLYNEQHLVCLASEKHVYA